MNVIRLLLVSAVLLVLVGGCGGGGSGPNGGTIPIQPPGPGVNQAPAITSLSPQGTTASPVRLPTDAKQRLVVAASDPDNDTLTYAWRADQGSVTAAGQEADFAAPATPCNAVVTVEVSDGHNHKASACCYFSVYKPKVPPPPPPPANSPPVIAGLVADPASVQVGGTSTITVTASDPEGDPLTYSFAADGGGIQSQNGNVVVWRAPAAAGGCSVTASVSDGHNPAVSKSVAISVAGVIQPPLTNGLWGRYIQNSGVYAHPDLWRGALVFTRVDPTVNFDWGRKAPDPRLVTDPDTGHGHDFGIIWTGYVKCQAAGVYAFQATYDDGFRLSISNDANQMQRVIDGWYTGPATTQGTISLQGGKWYKLEALYFEDEDQSYIQFYWRPPGAPSWAIVPTGALRTN